MPTGSVQNIVETTFTIGDHATNQLHNLGGAAERAGEHLTGLNSLVGMAKAALVGWIGKETIDKVTELGDKFEQNQIKIGGMLAALGQAGDINEGLKMADQTIQAINVAAAKLPGEAEDYVDVFRGVFPQVQRAIGGSLQEMYGFTNQLTAIGKAFGLDAGVIARETAMMLGVGHGRAGAHIVLWQSLLPYIQKASGQMALTAEQFNKMSEAARGKLIADSFKGLQPMLDKAGSSFDAMKGAFVSSVKLMARLGTQPLFEGIKNGLFEVNSMLMDDQGALTEMGQRIANVGQNISVHIVNGFRAAGEAIKWVASQWDAISASPTFTALNNTVDNLKNLAGHAIAGIGSQLGAMESGEAVGVGRNTLSGATGEIGERAAALLEEITGSLTPVVDALISSGAAIVDVFRNIGPDVMSAIQSIAGPLLEFGSSMFTSLGEAIEYVRPHLASFASHLGALVRSIGEMLEPALRLLGNVAGWVYDKFAGIVEVVESVLLDSFSDLADAIKMVVDAITWLLKKIPGAEAPIRTNASLEGLMPKIDDYVAPAMQLTGSVASAVKKMAEATAHTPHARGGGHTTQDFRFSKFYLDQKFAEGYDPDRIATTIMADIGRSGERRLQSGHEMGVIR